jgi:hypothetical protein
MFISFRKATQMKTLLGMMAMVATALLVHYFVDPMLAVSGIALCGALEVLSGFVTAPSTTFTNVAGGDFTAGNVQVRNFTPGTDAYLLNCWHYGQSGFPITKITSPRIHDNTVGLRHRPISSQVYPLMSGKYPQRLFAQDVLNVQAQGSATGGDIEIFSMLVYYQSLSGSDAFLISPQQLQQLGVNVTTIEVPITAGTAGGWSGQAAANSGTQALKANTRYALVGGHSSLLQASVGVRGSDFGNLRLGFPGNAADKLVNGNFFVDLSEQFGFGLIPVFNSANLAGMLVDVANNENAASPIVTLNVVQLAG